MRMHDIELPEGADGIKNLIVESGTSFPANPDVGQVFYRTDLGSSFVCTNSSTPVWERTRRWNDREETAAVTIASGDKIFFVASGATDNTPPTEGGLTVGDEFIIIDNGGNFATYNFTIKDIKVRGSVQDVILDTNWLVFRMFWTGTTNGWDF